MKITKKRQEELNAEKAKLFKRLGIPLKFKSTYNIPFPDYKITNSTAMSNSIDGICPKKDAMAYMWKRGSEETQDTIREIEKKKKMIAPLFNKGGYQLITPETDSKTIGRK